MALPSVPLPRETISLPDGQTVDIRGLSRYEALKVYELTENLTEMETTVIAYGTDTPVEDARAWYESAPVSTVQPIIEAISKLSGMDDLGKESATG